jgi:hypothetical protein
VIARTGIALIVAVAVAHANGRAPASNAVRFRPGDTQAIYVGTTFGMLVSTDGCQFYWLCEDNIGFGGAFDPAYAVTASGAILAGTFQGLRVSRDGGCSFTPVHSELYIDAVALGPTGDVWIGTAEAGSGNLLLHSSDDAASFAAAGGLPGTMWFESIAVAPSNPMRIYVAAFQISSGTMPPTAHLFRSDDGGASWTELSLAGVQFASSPHLRIGAVDPHDPDTVFVISLGSNAVTGDRVYRSNDAAVTLSDVLDTPHVTADLVIRANRDIVVATPFDSSFVSRDGGATFQPLVAAPQLACLGERDGVLYGCGSNYTADPQALTSSVDEATWHRVLRFELIAGPLDCPSGTFENDICDDQMWRTFSQQLGITPGNTCAAGSDTSVDMPARDGQPSRGGCCDAGGRPPVVASVVISILALRRRGRR